MSAFFSSVVAQAGRRPVGPGAPAPLTPAVTQTAIASPTPAATPSMYNLLGAPPAAAVPQKTLLGS